MKITDNEFVDYLLDKVSKMIDKKLRGLKFVKDYAATVTVDNGNGTFNVLIAGDSANEITNLKDKSGETLSVGDEVILFALNNNLSNLFIAFKK